VVGTPKLDRGATALVGAPARTTLLDRALERAALHALLNAVREGLSGTLVLRGEPGGPRGAERNARLTRRAGYR